MSIATEFREHFSWTFEGAICAIKQRKDSVDWVLDLPEGQSIRLSSAALASLKANLRRLPNSTLRAVNSSLTRTGLPWTAEDDAELISAFRSCMPLGMVAARLGRSRYAVELHLEKLGLTPPGSVIDPVSKPGLEAAKPNRS